MLRKFHIERSVSCRHLLIRSSQVVRITSWTPDIVMSTTPIKSLDVKRRSWPPLVQYCFYLEVFHHEMTSVCTINGRECFTIKNSQVKANRFECQIPVAVTADTGFLPVHTHASVYWRLVILHCLVCIFVSCCQRSFVLQYYVYCTCARFSYYFISGKPGVSAELDQFSSMLKPCSKRRTLKPSHFKLLCLYRVCLHCCLTE
jgi:hypothetical protein